MKCRSAVPATIALCLLVLSVFLAGCDSAPVRHQENGSVRILSLPAGAEI